MKKFVSIISALMLIFIVPLSAEEKKEDKETSQWVKDLRRTEIITFGSLPFVTLWTTVGYSFAVYGKFKNPLDKSTSSFTKDDQWHIIEISAASCLCLGLFDFSYNYIKRSLNKNEKKENPDNSVEILAYSVKLSDESDLKPVEEALPEYYVEGAESALY